VNFEIQYKITENPKNYQTSFVGLLVKFTLQWVCS